MFANLVTLIKPRPRPSLEECIYWDAGERNDEQQLLIAARHHHHHRGRYHGNGRCPTGFIYRPATRTCYLLRGEQVTWDVAERHCRRLGARLLTIRSSVEQRQLTELAPTNSGQQAYIQ